MVTFGFFDSGDLFQFKHIVLMVVSAVLCVFWTIWAVKHLKMETFYKVLLISGIISEVIKAFTYILNNEDILHGYLNKGDLPLHMCSMQIILFAILVFCKNEKVRRVIRSFQIPTCLIGGIGAMVISTWSSRNLWPITITYYIHHILLTSWGIFLLSKNEPKLTVKDFVTGFVMYSAVFFASFYINSILYVYEPVYDEVTHNLIDMQLTNVNFLYTVNPPADGLPLLNKDHGWGVYIAHYLIIFYAAIVVIYIKPIIEFFKERKQKKLEAK